MFSKIFIPIFSFFIIITCGCSVLTKTHKDYMDFTNSNNLDSLDLVHKQVFSTFFNAVKNKDTEKVKSLCSDSVFCSWEMSLDTTLKHYNSNLMPLQNFMNTYYKQALEGKDFSNPTGIFYISKGISGHIIGKELNGMFVKLGPKKCTWEPCHYSNFDFIKTKDGYKFVGMWHL